MLSEFIPLEHKSSRLHCLKNTMLQSGKNTFSYRMLGAKNAVSDSIIAAAKKMNVNRFQNTHFKKNSSSSKENKV